MSEKQPEESPVTIWRRDHVAGKVYYRVVTPCCGKRIVVEGTELRNATQRGEPLWVTCGLTFWLRPQRTPGCGREWGITATWDEMGREVVAVRWTS